MKNTIKNSRETIEKRDVYLLKIYRRSALPASSIVGTVEEIPAGKKTVFRTGEELIRWLDDQADQNSLPS